MLSEYKKDNTAKEIARLSEDLRRKKDMAKSLETQASQRREEMKQFDAIGFTKDEVQLHINASTFKTTPN